MLLLTLTILPFLLTTVHSLRMTFQQDTLAEPTAPPTEKPADLQWALVELLNDAPEKRRGHTSIVVGDDLLVFGGCYLDQKCFNDLHSFDTRTKTWSTQKTNGIPPAPREGHTASVVGSRMYLFGGSGSSAYYNDLFIFDLETKTWLEVSFQGPKPSPRANHGAVVDKKGRILIFGGFTENGYSAEFFILDPVEEKWQKPFVSGQAPAARENFSMTRVRNAVWIFGGFQDGGVLSDLVILDLENMAWNTVETFGTKPVGRQGHGAVLQERNLLMFGGCDYKVKKCYSDMYSLDTDSLWWKKMTDETTAKFTPRESFSTNYMGSMIYVFGGCKLYEECYNDVLMYDTGIPCPNKCSDNGVCRNDRCMCSQGFFDNDCSLAVRCKDDCSNHGQCRSNGKCACYPGYTGEGCNIISGCPNNCTSADQGTCLPSGKCQCLPSYSGDSCEKGQTVSLLCAGDCSKHGTCDTTTGKCICDKYYTGDSCSVTIDEKQLAQAKAAVRAQELADAAKEEDVSTIEKVRRAMEEDAAKATLESISASSGVKPPETPVFGTEDPEIKAQMEKEIAEEEERKARAEAAKQAEEGEEGTKEEEAEGEEEEEKTTDEDTEAETGDESSSTSEETSEETVDETSGDEATESGDTTTTDEESLVQKLAKEEGLVNIKEFQSISLLDETLKQSGNTSTGSASSGITREALEAQLTGGASVKSDDKETAAEETEEDQGYENKAIEGLTPQMFSSATSKERKLQEKKQQNSTKDNGGCPSSCSFNGICENKKCYCSNGYTGEDCSISNVQELKEGETLDKLAKYAAVCFVIGGIIGIFLIVALIQKAKESEYMNIQPKEEEED